MATIKYWGGAGLTPSALTTSSSGSGDSAFDSITGASNIAVVADGLRTPCIGVSNGTGLSYAQWNPVTPLEDWKLSFLLKVTEATSGLIFFSSYDSGGAKVAGFDFTSSGALRLSTNPGTNVNFYVAPSAFPLGSWTRIEYTEAVTGAWSLSYFNGDSSTALVTAAGTKATPQTLSSVRAGRISGALASNGLWLDELTLADTTPLPPPGLTRTGGTPASQPLASDRTETVAWPAIEGASGYRALTAPYGTTDYEVVGETVSSPYTFLNLPGGPIRIAIQAKGDN